MIRTWRLFQLFSLLFLTCFISRYCFCFNYCLFILILHLFVKPANSALFCGEKFCLIRSSCEYKNEECFVDSTKLFWKGFVLPKYLFSTQGDPSLVLCCHGKLLGWYGALDVDEEENWFQILREELMTYGFYITALW